MLSLKNFAKLIAISLSISMVSGIPAAMASDRYECTGGTYQIDEGLVSDLHECTGTVVLHSSARSIDSYSLFDSGVTSITLPEKFDNVNGLINSYPNTKLSEINVAPTNPLFSSRDGVLYEKDFSTLLRFPPGRTGSFSTLSETRILGGSSFSNTSLESLTLSEGLKQIDVFALFDSTKLKKLSFPSTLEDYFSSSIVFLSALETITVSPLNPKLAAINNSLIEKATGKLLIFPIVNLGEVCEIPANIKIIAYGALNRAPCTSVVFPSSLEEIEGGAFDGSEVRVLTIPLSVKTLGINPFYGAEKLQRIEVASGHTLFSSTDGVLFNKAGTEMLSYPEGNKRSEYTVPKKLEKGAEHLGMTKNLLDIRVEEESTFYKSVDGVLFDFAGETLIAYPGARTDNFYILPKGVKKVLDWSWLNVVQLISLDDPSSVDTTTTGRTVLGLEEGLLSLGNLYRNYRSGAESRISDLLRDVEAARTTDIDYRMTLERLSEFMAELDSESLSRTVACTGGTMNVDYSNFLRSASGCKGELTLPADLKGIYMYAFSDSNELTKLNIGPNVTSISDSIVVGADALTNISVDKENSYFTSVGGVLFNKAKTKLIAYPPALSADTYKIPEGVVEIKEDAFRGAKIQTIELPKSLTSLNSDPFINSLISAVKIPAELAVIDEGSFAHMPKLKEFVVSPGNADYKSLNGVLFDWQVKSLISYPPAKAEQSYIVPQGVTRIADYAFDSAPLTRITLADSIVELGSPAFRGSKIQELNIPASVETLSSSSFLGASELAKLTVANNNSSFTSIDNVLFTKNKEELIFYPPKRDGVSYKVPEGTKLIRIASLSSSPIKELTIPESISSLSEMLLAGTLIEKLNLSATLEGIDDWSFYDSYNLKEVTVPASNPFFKAVDGILYDKKSTKLIHIPYRSPIKNLTIPEGVKDLPQGSSKLSSFNLESISIPSSITGSLEGALGANFNLRTITVAEGNPSYVSKDGVLFDKGMKTMIYYPDKRGVAEYKVPESVTNFSESVRFADESLKKLTLSSALKEVSTSNFYSAAGIDTIIYDGTSASVKQILSGLDLNLTTTAEIEAKLLAEEEAKKKAAAELLAAERLVKAESEAKLAKEAQTKAETEAKLAKEAQTKAESEAKLAKEAQAAAESEAKLAKEAQAKAESEAKLAKEAQSKAESEAKLAKEAQAKAESEAKLASEMATQAEKQSKLQEEKSLASQQALTSLETQYKALEIELAKYKPSTITCKKGKTTRKVTAVNPKCPVGFKKS